MYKTILEEIYYSNCGQAEKLKAGEEYWRLERQSGEYFDKLNSILNEEQQEWLDRIWELSAGMETEWGYTNFRAGLQFGARLMIEVLNGKNTPSD